MSNKKEIPNISASEAAKMSVSALAVRPNDASRFGQGGLSAEMLKARFDALPNLVREKFNKIAEMLAGTDAAKYITLGGEDNALGETLFDFLALFGPRGTGINDKNISDYIETLYAPLGESTEKSVALKDIVSDIARRLVDASAGHVVDAHLDSVTNTLVITFADGTDARVDLSPLAAGVGLQGEIDRLKETDADLERRLSNIEEHISDDYFVTDDSVAYEKAVPARACSSAKLMSLGGMTYRDEETNTLRDSKVTEIKSHGKNLFNKDAEWYAYSIGDGDTIIEHASYRTWFIDVSGLDNVCISHNNPNSAGDFIVTAVRDTKLGTLIDMRHRTLYKGQSHSISLQGYNYVAVSMWYTWVDEVAPYVQVEAGSVATEYKPFREPISYPIPAEIQVGRGINGYADTIDFDAKKRTQRVNTVELTGNETYSSGSYYIITNNIYCPKGATSTGMIFTEAYPIVFSNTQLNNFQFGSTTDSIFNYFADLAEFKAYLAERYASGNPVTITYALAEPIETDISESLEDFDNIIEIEGGGSLEFVNEFENPVPSAVKYLLKEESAV